MKIFNLPKPQFCHGIVINLLDHKMIEAELLGCAGCYVQAARGGIANQGLGYRNRRPEQQGGNLRRLLLPYRSGRLVRGTIKRPGQSGLEG